jgi:hypothetical protein
MMIMYPGAEAEIAGRVPTDKDIAAMMKFTEEMSKAGALLAYDGLHPTSEGARVRYRGGKPKVTDGPFTEAKEIVAGYWMIQAKTKEEAIEWAKKVPAAEGEMVEIRRVWDESEFAIDPRSEVSAQMARTGARIDAKKGKG